MRKIFVLLMIMAMAGLISFCGGQKELAKVDQDATEFVQPDDQPKVESVTKPRESERAVKEAAPSVESLTFEGVYFDFDKYDLTAEAREILAENARLLKNYPSVKLLIEGHCDERGTIEYNLVLGERRSNSVKVYLTNYGIHPDRVYTISYGKERPVDGGHTEEAWAKNRRAAFNIVQR
ncbi:MAG: peptidoglycan-associated lipoprotein Pal [bacterium]